MSIKTETSEAMPEAVWSGGVLEAEGRDAGAFLQAQLMNDVSQLGVGDWQWNGWLSPKGRVIALTLLLRRGEQLYWLVLPDYPATRLADDLRRFQFRSKLSLRARDDLFLQPGADRTGAETGRGAVARIELGGQASRALEISAVPPATGDRDSIASWRLADLAHGLPRLPESAVALHTPQMLGLDRLHAFSVKKGCYPGQEIVARTHFLGQAKRGLRRLIGNQPIAPGSGVLDAGHRIGDILCSASVGDRHEALAVLPLELQATRLAGEHDQALTLTDFAHVMHR